MSSQPLAGGLQHGLPRSYLRPCMLMLLSEGQSHGYELLEQVRELGLVGADAGGLYRTLRAMENEEMVRSWWEPSQAGPARRTYELTDVGRKSLEASVRTLDETYQLLGRLLARCGAVPNADRP